MSASVVSPASSPRGSDVVCVRRRKNSLQGSMSVSVISPASSPWDSDGVCVRRRKNSLQGSMSASVVSPASSPQLGPARPMAHLVATATDSHSVTTPGSPSVSAVAWRARLHSIKNNFLGSPRFHRKKLQGQSQCWLNACYSVVSWVCLIQCFLSSLMQLQHCYNVLICTETHTQLQWSYAKVTVIIIMTCQLHWILYCGLALVMLWCMLLSVDA